MEIKEIDEVTLSVEQISNALNSLKEVIDKAIIIKGKKRIIDRLNQIASYLIIGDVNAGIDIFLDDDELFELLNKACDEIPKNQYVEKNINE